MDDYEKVLATGIKNVIYLAITAGVIIGVVVAAFFFIVK